MMMIVPVVRAAVVALVISSPAVAATLRFPTPYGNTNRGEALELDNAFVRPDDDHRLYWYRDPQTGDYSFGGLNYGYDGDTEIIFKGLVSNFRFEATNGWRGASSASVSAFSRTDTLLNSFDISADGFYDFGSLDGIARLYFDVTANEDGDGFIWRNVRFNQVTPVPLPAGLPLMIAGLAASLALLHRRKA